MRLVKKILRAGLVVLLVLAAAALWKREEVTRLLAVNSLFAEDRIVQNFSNMDGLFLHRELPRGPHPVTALPEDPRPMPAGLDAWMEARAVTGLVVLKDGRIAAERYRLGTAPDDRRISWSVAKSYLSILLGVLLEEGAVASLDVPVTDYAPDLRGSAYDGARLRDVVQMASGVEFNEDYFDFWSDINRMGRVLALGSSMDGFAAGLDRTRAAPGADWHYVSIDTHVIGMVIRGATGRSIHELMAEKVIAPLGLERAPYYLTDGEGVAFVLGGLNMTTRDFARFGLMVAQGGRIAGRRVVPENWIAVSTTPSAPTDPGATQYGYQWWIAPDAPKGEVFARGVYGQYIFIDRARGVVIAVNGADREFRAPGAHESNIAMFREIRDVL
ncbi:6-aminohexanoate hydrolase [Maritimibacter sp. 55A14]|uniref:serine hydrolase domain-containing protein n=1 Tax=Maritimibacter sp. 55A14 TaxID=2174844 RepID=UPI000D60B328|nr:serine hydrolase [Maritimibacter sp. 55A14]PWE31352.1 6-aminohexanoate hydrolase [Maritimibacter sp. 55A14]